MKVNKKSLALLTISDLNASYDFYQKEFFEASDKIYEVECEQKMAVLFNGVHLSYGKSIYTLNLIPLIMERSRLHTLSFKTLLSLKKHFQSKIRECFPYPEMPPKDPAMYKQYKADIESIDDTIFNLFHDLKGTIDTSNGKTGA